LSGVLVLQELIRRDHRDAIPRADLVTQCAADASGEIDRADLKGGLMSRARKAIEGGYFSEFRAEFIAKYKTHTES